MSLHRWDARRDDNEAAIVKALRAAGATVIQLSGRKVCDLLVGFRGKTFLMGVKKPDGPRGGKRARLRKSGDHRPEQWAGGPWEIVTTEEQALRLLLGEPPVSYGEGVDPILGERLRPAHAGRDMSGME